MLFHVVLCFVYKLLCKIGSVNIDIHLKYQFQMLRLKCLHVGGITCHFNGVFFFTFLKGPAFSKYVCGVFKCDKWSFT